MSCLSVRQKSGPSPTIALILAKMDVSASTSKMEAKRGHTSPRLVTFGGFITRVESTPWNASKQEQAAMSIMEDS